MRKLMNYKDTTIGIVIFGGSVFYSLYHVYKVSSVINLNPHYSHYDEFDGGWYIIARKRDAADEEWETAKVLIASLSPWIVLHIVISQLLRNERFSNFLPAIQLVLSAMYIIFHFNIYCLLFIAFQPLVFEIFKKVRKKRMVWICTLVNLVVLECFKTNAPLNCLQKFNITEKQHFMLVLSVYWLNLRCASYYISRSDQKVNSNIIEILSYSLYLPLLFFGPFISYEDFKKGHVIQDTKLGSRVKVLFQNLLRYTFWWIFTELFLHYIYVNIISFHPQLVQQFDSVTLYGFGYSMGQFFHLKYVVIYGLTTTIAQFDGMPIPNIPKCIARIHLYSDMWKYFDNGLYKFLLRYIYVPVNSATSSPYLSSFICFSFIYIWHGFLRMDIFIWAAFNCFAVCVERIFKSYYHLHLKKFCTKYLSEDWERRVGCMISAPLLMMSAVSNFYFFGGTEIGHIFVHRILEDKLMSTFLLLFTLYCCGLLSTAVKQVELEKKINKDV